MAASFSFADAAAAASAQAALPATDMADDDGAEVLMMPSLSFVEEESELQQLIASWAAATDRPPDSEFERFEKIIDKYQEQPQLLDPHLEKLVTPIMDIVLKNQHNVSFVNRLLRVVYVLSKVRGFRTIVKFLPHEVVHLELVIRMLESRDPTEFETWQARYALLLWLSIVILVPFDLVNVQALDAGAAVGPTGGAWAARVPPVDFGAVAVPLIARRALSLCTGYLCDAGRTRDAAAECIGRLVTRLDVLPGLPAFLRWATALAATHSDPFLEAGVLAALVAILTHGSRSELLPLLPIVRALPATLMERFKSQVVLRKLTTKLAQRLALTYLPPRLAAWRYQRGARSTLQCGAHGLLRLCLTSCTGHRVLLGSRSGAEAPAAPAAGSGGGEGEADDAALAVPEAVEETIGLLLDALGDADTVIRWSAAKGVGRIMGRLPRALAEDVLDSVQGLFAAERDDTSWHGGCLALAELARRGLLLPARLADVVPLVTRALRFDVRRGTSSVGNHVRDAACYVCWAFARAYAPAELAPFVPGLARELVVMSLLDREVNCRRAAAAAFQENVGRQGSFPHGIEIITQADFFSLGNRTRAYLEIAPKIAHYDEYREPLIDNLVDTKLPHWDPALRELASRALGLLATLDPPYMQDSVLPLLLAQCTHDDLAVRHGAVLGVAEVVRRLGPLTPSLATAVPEVVVRIEKARLYRGRGGEILRGAVSRLIECMALARFPLDPALIVRLQSTLDDNLRHSTEDIATAAAAAMRVFGVQYYHLAPAAVCQHIERYLAGVTDDPLPGVRRGYALALGALPRNFAAHELDRLLQQLSRAALLEPDVERRDAETRRNAVTALATAALTVGVAASARSPHSDPPAAGDTQPPFHPDRPPERQMSRAQAHAVLDTLLAALDDYATDDRGDVGSWVREAAMRALPDVAVMLAEADTVPGAVPDDSIRFLDVPRATLLVQKLIQQALEKIDHVRAVAGTALRRVLYSAVGALVPCRDELAPLVPSDPLFNWAAPGETFPRLVRAILLPTYRPRALLGLVVSVGGLTESLVRHSGAALVEVLRAAPTGDAVEAVVRDTLPLATHPDGDRVAVPWLRMVDLCLNQGVLERIGGDCAMALLGAVRSAMRGCTDVVKLTLCASVLCGLLSFEAARRGAFASLAVLLAHKYPKVRRVTAEQLYVRLVTDDYIVPGEKGDEAQAILSSTRWDGALAAVRAERDRLCAVLGIEPPRAAGSAAAAATSPE